MLSQDSTEFSNNMACLPRQSIGVGFPLVIEEETPMTMQVALRTLSGGIVFASDTRIRTREQEYSSNPDSVLGSVNRPKIVASRRHEIAAALAGHSDQGKDPTEELAEYLSEQNAIPDDISPLLLKWGDQYFQRKYPGEKHDFPLFTVLVVNPRTEYAPFRKLRVRRESDDQVSETYMVNGNESNSAVFWLDYFKCDKKLYDIETATRIAASTILSASELNPYAIGGLEVWQYQKSWSRLTRAQLEAEIVRFETVKQAVDRLIS